MALKYINLQIADTGLTVYARIQKESDGNWYDDGDGTFKAYAQANVVSLTEDANVKRTYLWNGGSSVIWPDGRYYIHAFSQVGGSPDDDNDNSVGYGTIIVSDDKEVSNDELNSELTLIKGALGFNCVLDDFTYDAKGKALTGNMYIYDGPTRIATHVSGTGGPGLLQKIEGIPTVDGNGNTTLFTRREL